MLFGYRSKNNQQLVPKIIIYKIVLQIGEGSSGTKGSIVGNAIRMVIPRVFFNEEKKNVAFAAVKPRRKKPHERPNQQNEENELAGKNPSQRVPP